MNNRFLKAVWRVALVLVILLHIFGFSVAMAADNEKEKPVAVVKPKKMFVPAGTPVILEIDVGFATNEVKEGDTIPLPVRRSVRVQDGLVIRQGVYARAKVLGSKAAAGWGAAGELTLGIRSVPAVDGSEILLQGKAGRRGDTLHGAATGVAVGTGLLCLPLALTGFAVTGEEGKFPPGYEIVAHTDGDHFVKVLNRKEMEEIYNEQRGEAIKAGDRFKKHVEELRKKKEEEKKAVDQM